MGRAHGVKGEVVIDVRTDAPDLRFANGASMLADDARTLTVARSHWHSDKLLVLFDGVHDRTGAEALNGAWLSIDQESAGEAGEDAYWDHELIGLRAVSPTGEQLGDVVDVSHATSQPLLEIRIGDRSAYVPFVVAFVVEVDTAGSTITLDLPEGLLDI